MPISPSLHHSLHRSWARSWTGPISAPSSVLTTCQTLAFVSPDAGDRHLIAQLERSGCVYVFLSPYANGVAQIATILRHCPQVQSLLIHTKGHPGCLELGTAHLTTHNLERYAWSLQAWFAHFPSFIKPSITLVGCKTGDGPAGITFIDRLHQLTGCHIHYRHSATHRPLQLVR